MVSSLLLAPFIGKANPLQRPLVSGEKWRGLWQRREAYEDVSKDLG